jgi:protein translocase SecG subunit
MQTVLISIHLMVVIALVIVVLLQRSEGGGLGIGGGSGGFMTGRGQANLLTRATAGLAAVFFITSLLLTVLAARGSGHADRTGAARRTGRQFRWHIVRPAAAAAAGGSERTGRARPGQTVTRKSPGARRALVSVAK